MPYVNVRILEGATAEQKAEIIKQITHTLVTVLNKKPERTHIVIDDVPAENWGFGGLPTTAYLK